MQAAVALQSLQLDPTEEDPEVALSLSLSLPLSPAACAPAAESTAVTLHAESRAVAPSCAAAELLLGEWQAGTKTAATRFYYLYKDRVYRWARIKARDHHLAEDLCQEVWRRIHRSVLTYRAGTSPNAWVYRILINTHRSLWRRGQRFFASLLPGLSGEEVSEGPPGTVTQAGSSPEALFTRKQELEVILKAMHEIPEPFRKVVFLRYVEGLPIDEVATILGVTDGTVKSRLSRGIEKLRERLGLRGQSQPGVGR